MRYKWEVFKGESIESEDLLFSAREPNIFSFKTSLDVSLPSQQSSISTAISSIEPDFRTYGRYIGSSFKLFEPIHNTLLAEVRSLLNNIYIYITLKKFIYSIVKILYGRYVTF